MTNAQASHDLQIAQGDVTDAVFAMLPDVLVPRADGTPLTLTPDFITGYEANDFYVGATQSMFDYGGAAVLMTPLEPYTGMPPDFTPGDLALNAQPYGAEGHPSGYGWMFGYGDPVGNIMPWGLLGGAQGPVTLGDTSGADSVIGGGGGAIIGTPTGFALRDPLRVAGSLQALIPQNYQIAMHFAGNAAAVLAVAAEGTGDESWSTSLWYWFFGRNHAQPNEGPSNGGGNSGPESTYQGPGTNDGTNALITKINYRGRMAAKNSLDLENQHIKNSVKYGNFQIAIYEGVADALEDQIWNLATAGVLGDAEAELIQIAAKRSYSAFRNVIDITVDAVKVRVGADDVAKIQKVLKDRGQAGTIDDVVDAIKGFAFKALKQSTEEAREIQRWGEMLAKLWKKPQKLLDLVEELGGTLHAHHIVMKTIPKIGARSEQVRKWIIDSQAILKWAEVNLFDDAKTFNEFAKQNAGSYKADAENFAWAIMREGYGLHSDDYVEAVYKRLEAASKVSKDAVKNELAKMRSLLEEGKSFWDKNDATLRLGGNQIYLASDT